jgi:CheY-like chemotaxis protein/DNA-directed RNA polymerase subunit RPC12/RpoP
MQNGGDNMENTKYCLCCNEQVPFSVIERQGKREIKCAYCGFILDIERLSELKKTVVRGHALIADDSKYTRRIIEDILREKKFAEHVESFKNGAALIAAYAKLLSENKPVDVAIIDVNMPVMDGLTAAKTLRALEVQKNAASVPIVFFSGEKADEHLKKQMEELAPALYMNKSADPDPDNLAKRVEELVSYVLERYGHR